MNLLLFFVDKNIKSLTFIIKNWMFEKSLIFLLITTFFV
jgi:hypothetical protein